MLGTTLSTLHDLSYPTRNNKNQIDSSFPTATLDARAY